MPNLSATRTYADNRSPVQSDFDAFIDDIEILVNTIQLDDENFQAGGIDASTKFVNESIDPNQIRNNNVTSAKIADGAVNTAAIQDNAVTTAKLANAVVDEAVTNITAGYLPPGAVQMFHTFDGTVSYPRGWMLCNGNVVNQTNYDAIHGAGAYTADNVANSPLLSKNLPDMSGHYAIGVADTTKDGSSTISTVGNVGHEIDIRHTHDVDHEHAYGIADDNTTSDITFAGTGNAHSAVTGGTGNLVESGPASVTTTNQSLSDQQSIQPDSIQVLYILKVI